MLDEDSQEKISLRLVFFEDRGFISFGYILRIWVG